MRLPKDLQIAVREVEIFRRRDERVSQRVSRRLTAAFDLLVAMPNDFMVEGRKDAPPQVRVGL